MKAPRKLYRMGWLCNGFDKDGQPRNESGIVVCAAEDILERNIRWMARYDWGMTIREFACNTFDTKPERESSDAALIFIEGPSPSYINGEEPTTPPWGGGPQPKPKKEVEFLEGGHFDPAPRYCIDYRGTQGDNFVIEE